MRGSPRACLPAIEALQHDPHAGAGATHEEVGQEQTLRVRRCRLAAIESCEAIEQDVGRARARSP